MTKSKIAVAALLLATVMTSCYRPIVPLPASQQAKITAFADDLRGQTLIVRLYTNNPKKRFLQESGNTTAVANHRADRQEYAKLMIETWTGHYDFSKLLFLPDSLYDAFAAKADMPLFLNEDLELDPTLKLETETYYILARGQRDYAFVWLDKDLREVRPQPPINYNKLSIWEILLGTEEVLTNRVIAIDEYLNML